MEYDSGVRQVGLRNGSRLTFSVPVKANARRRFVIGKR